MGRVAKFVIFVFIGPNSWRNYTLVIVRDKSGYGVPGCARGATEERDQRGGRRRCRGGTRPGERGRLGAAARASGRGRGSVGVSDRLYGAGKRSGPNPWSASYGLFGRASSGWIYLEAVRGGREVAARGGEGNEAAKVRARGRLAALPAGAGELL